MDTLTVNDHAWRLARFPLRKKEPLRAWDAADEYVLFHCDEQKLLAASPRTLIVNDSFGALAVALAAQHPVSWGDSCVARLAMRHNLEANDLAPDCVSFIPADTTPDGVFDLVLLKLPKSLIWWEDLLLQLRPHLHADTTIIVGGMIKYSPKRAYRLMERCLGPTTTSLGRKKARLAFAAFDSGLTCPERAALSEYPLPETDLILRTLPNVFSYEHLDNGTRLLLSQLPAGTQPLRIADLGCGNGALTIMLAQQCPRASILALDESYLAVACARTNVERANLSNDHEIEFQVADGFADQPERSFDLVVCNPPFHQAQAVGDQIAWGMFRQCRQVLKVGGELRIVGNRHLGYHAKLKRLFGVCKVVESKGKFVVLSAVKQ